MKEKGRALNAKMGKKNAKMGKKNMQKWVLPNMKKNAKMGFAKHGLVKDGDKTKYWYYK